MKYIQVVTVVAALAMAACESMNAPLTSSGDFDPLAPAGGANRTGGSNSGSSFKPGQFVHAMIDNTAFFSKRPKGDADADKLLARNTPMKVVSSDSSYVKVELDSGEVGFVPAVMVVDPNTASAENDPGLYMPGSGPVEPLPNLTPSNLPPDGIPPIIDPSAPIPGDPGDAVPPPAPGDAAAPVPPPAPGATPAPAPLPPGIDDKPAGQ
jgi:hypothetical protein